MTSPKSFFDAYPQLPKWLKQNKLFTEVKSITKVFPSIGLYNFAEEYAIDNFKEIEQAALSLIHSLDRDVAKRKTCLTKFNDGSHQVGKKRKASLEGLIEVLGTLDIQMRNKTKNFITKTDTGKITLNLPTDIQPKANPKLSSFKKGQGLFRVYNQLNEDLKANKFVQLKAPDNLHEFKTFSAVNIPTKGSSRIVFSSSDPEGLWDIATMSMRGIRSCQSWDGDYPRCLIGSILDPFVGIIYLTSGAKEEYGTKMIRRCMVRFAINEKTMKPVIVLDRMYPSLDQNVCDAFVSIIKSKLNEPYEVLYAEKAADRDYGEFIPHLYMPLTDIRKKLGNKDIDKLKKKNTPFDPYYNNKSQPFLAAKDAQFGSTAAYQDILIPSRQSKTDTVSDLENKKAEPFIKVFKKAFSDAIKKADTDKITSPVVKAAFSALQGSSKKGKAKDHAAISRDLGTILAKDVIASVSPDPDGETKDRYLKRLCQSYLTNKSSIINTSKSKLAKEINDKLSLKKNQKLTGRHIVRALDDALPCIDDVLKKQLLKLVEEAKSNPINPLPLP